MRHFFSYDGGCDATHSYVLDAMIVTIGSATAFHVKVGCDVVSPGWSNVVAATIRFGVTFLNDSG